MTQTFSTNANNDLFLNAQGNLAISTGIDAVLLNCEHAVKTMLGECVLDLERGMPNFQVIWNGAPSRQQYDAALRQTILAVDGVSSISELIINIVSGALVYQATIVTIYGTGAING